MQTSTRGTCMNRYNVALTCRFRFPAGPALAWHRYKAGPLPSALPHSPRRPFAQSPCRGLRPVGVCCAWRVLGPPSPACAFPVFPCPPPPSPPAAALSFPRGTPRTAHMRTHGWPSTASAGSSRRATPAAAAASGAALCPGGAPARTWATLKRSLSPNARARAVNGTAARLSSSVANTGGLSASSACAERENGEGWPGRAGYQRPVCKVPHLWRRGCCAATAP